MKTMILKNKLTLVVAGASLALVAGMALSPRPSAPAAVPQQQEAAQEPAHYGHIVPMVLTLKGPEAQAPSGDIPLDLTIKVNTALHGPVQLKVNVPPGATLVQGEAVETLMLNKVGTSTRHYVVRSEGPLRGEVTVVADMRDGNKFGLRAERKYPERQVTVSNLPLARPPVARPGMAPPVRGQ